jgi:pyridoxamine 5'-phosphate oxidase
MRVKVAASVGIKVARVNSTPSSAPARLATLPLIEAALWQELERATRDGQHEWHTPVLATTDGTVADARTVVLRAVDLEARQLLFYSDSRAPKVARLRSHPHGTLLMWSRRLSWQLRAQVRCEIETDGLAASSRWARLKFSPAAQDYLATMPPGAPLDSAVATRGERAHFAVVTASVIAIDWLELHPDGHRRALFEGGAARWIQP